MQDQQVDSALYRAEQVRELDRRAIHEHGIPGYELMCRAGSACLHELRRRWPRARTMLVLCGAGNNAGDGYVIARLAHEQGMTVEVVYLCPPQKLGGDARTAWQQAEQAGISIAAFSPTRLPAADVVVDALLGTGLQRAVAGDWLSAVETLNGSDAPVLAVDIPSGLSADTGAVLGAAVRAVCTVTFIGLKRGLFTGMARDYCGEIHFDGLRVPAAVYRDCVVSAQRYRGEDVADLLGTRSRVAHKGRYGHVLAVGGNHGMAGALRMAAEAAARVGSGLVSAATRSDHAACQAVARPEVMFHGVSDRQALRALATRATVVAIGPGLGQGRWASMMFEAALALELPAVIDADALRALSSQHLSSDRWVLTPHAGEAAQLLGCDVQIIEQDRFAAVRAIQQRYGGVCVLKGAGTLVCSGEDAPVSVCESGNPGMASGGMGDVLTGVIAGLLAQGLAAADAARVGAWLHGTAADRAACEGERGLMATDLLVHLRHLVNGL